ncbi:hypothetical protein SAMN05421788_1011076 [Filimonas lacunae]|uniref:Uncharacterized protein n=1 Tax=Filimonas lacunae TaxID=477680 RepID=A0A173MPR5_9BACT|nr:hypothetical protein [Filimonas lacunae]BAV09642.1 hypothetical protein FLA_5693 [Filimonas lacunae]SIS76409.1 hypothetical protein SAMN05421788_1011076 [Filimonas lacunae]
MLKNILTAIFCLFLSLTRSSILTAQTTQPVPSDFFQLKKKNRTVKNYFRGTYAQFWFDGDQWVGGTITKIAHDSIWIRDQRIDLVQRGFGTVIDTISYDSYKIHINDITATPRLKENWAFVKNGTLFQVGSGAYIVVNVVNGFGKNADPLFGSKNAPKLGIASGIFLLGTLMHWLYKPEIRIGKKYRLQYVHAS